MLKLVYITLQFSLPLSMQLFYSINDLWYIWSMLYEVHITHTGSTFIYVLTVESNSKKKKKILHEHLCHRICFQRYWLGPWISPHCTILAIKHSIQQPQSSAIVLVFFFATLFVLHITEAFSAVSTSSQRAFLTIIHLLKNSEKHYILWKSFVMNNKLIIYSNIFNTAKI